MQGSHTQSGEEHRSSSSDEEHSDDINEYPAPASRKGKKRIRGKARMCKRVDGELSDSGDEELETTRGKGESRSHRRLAKASVFIRIVRGK